MLTVRFPSSQEAVDEEYKSEAEEEDKFDSDFNDSEVRSEKIWREMTLKCAVGGSERGLLDCRMTTMMRRGTGLTCGKSAD